MLPQLCGKVGFNLPPVPFNAVRLHLAGCLATGHTHRESTNHVQHAIDNDHAGLITWRRHARHRSPLLRVNVITVDRVNDGASARNGGVVPPAGHIQTSRVSRHAVVGSRRQHVWVLRPRIADAVVAAERRRHKVVRVQPATHVDVPTDDGARLLRHVDRHRRHDIPRVRLDVVTLAVVFDAEVVLFADTPDRVQLLVDAAEIEATSLFEHRCRRPPLVALRVVAEAERNLLLQRLVEASANHVQRIVDDRRAKVALVDVWDGRQVSPLVAADVAVTEVVRKAPLHAETADVDDRLVEPTRIHETVPVHPSRVLAMGPRLQQGAVDQREDPRPTLAYLAEDRALPDALELGFGYISIANTGEQCLCVLLPGAQIESYPRENGL